MTQPGERESHGIDLWSVLPVSMAAEIVCSRWTVLVVRELLCGSIGSTISAAGFRACPLVFCRSGLKELEQLGVVEVMATSHPVFMNTT